MVDRDPTIDFAQGGVDMRRPREPADRHAPADREHVFVNQLTGVRADDLCPDDLHFGTVAPGPATAVVLVIGLSVLSPTGRRRKG